MRDDLRFALRSLKASPTFTVVALLLLSLGIGATTAIFSVVDAVVLRGLPFDEHDRLVAVGERRPSNPVFGQDPNRDPLQLSSASPQNYLDWAARHTVFESIAALTGGLFAIRAAGESEELRAQRVTASFFDVLRARPRLGRVFTSEQETEGRHRVALISYGLWMRRFAGDPAAIGRTLPIEGGAYQVIGVMAPEFEYPVGTTRPTELWVPYVVPADERIRMPGQVSVYLQTIARLRPGVSMEQAQANLDQISTALANEHPLSNKDTGAGVRPLVDHIVGARTAQWMLLLLGAVGIVLLIACANVANLLLARASAREREIGVRAALGASRQRLLRQLLIESLLLSAIATAMAVLLAWWVVGVLKNAMPEGVPRITTIALDLRVLGAAALLSLASGVLFGIIPALHLSRADVSTVLKEGSRGASTGKARLRGALVVAEIALAVILLVGAALFIGSFRALMRIDPGFDAANLLIFSVVPRLDTSLGPPPDMTVLVEQMLERIRQVPGAQQVAAISGGVPLGDGMTATSVSIAGRTLTAPDNVISLRRITAEYFDAMRVPLTAGRVFTAADRQGGQPVAIVNESAARKYFPGESAIGKSLIIGKTPNAIVGVVGDVYQRGLESEPLGEVYTPLAQQRVVFSDLVIRTAGDPYEVLPAVKTAALGVMPDALLRNVRTMEEVIGRRTAQRRFNMLLLGLFGLLGLVIAAVGVYGVMAYLVAQRTREIGVRIALGATRMTVLALVLRNAGLLVTVGLILGSAGAWFLSSTAQAFVFRMDVHDPRVFAAALGVLASAAFIASLIPARRAASVDPTVALRAE